jgi:PAS domain S-box-containing protein
MKNKSVIPTDKEKFMRDNDFIVSKTDLLGIITYGNPIFVEFSGYSEQELLGVQHNIIRHPDMPRAAFNLVWATIKSGKECFAYVKNLSKDGGFYWVFAHITPENSPSGEPIGYYSVRRCPKRSAIEKIEPVYQKMLAAEQAAGRENAIKAGTQVLLDVLTSTGLGYEDLIFAL